LVIAVDGWWQIEKFTWRRVFAVSFLTAVLASFSPIVFGILLVLTFVGIFRDYLDSNQGIEVELFNLRLHRRIVSAITPILICAPWSFELIMKPSRFFIDSGFLIPGGGPNLAILGNPGGPGSLPWTLISPLSLILFISLFSSTRARRVAEIGFLSLIAATLLSALSLSGNGTVIASKIYTGTLLTITTVATISAAVIMLDKLRERLVATNINFRHISAALLLVTTILYAGTSVAWIVTKGADSPLQAGKDVVLPAFLAIESNTKTLVLRPRNSGDEISLNYYLARSGDATLGQPDLAPQEREQVANAVRELADGSGLTSSTTFSVHGIEYLFLKSPVDENVARIIDGLGGFNRASSTNAGIVWKTAGKTGQILFKDSFGKSSVLAQGTLGITVNSPGEITVTENYSRGWRAMQDGQRLERTRSVDGMPVFIVEKPGLVTLMYDGTLRRAWLSLQIIVVVTVLVMALPAGRRRREIEDAVLA
jgi:hypothetical protein